jgi:hypothetical protein
MNDITHIRRSNMHALPKKWALIAVMSALATVATTAREARALTSHSGASCQGVFPADTQNLTRTTSANNASTVNLNITCPLSLGTQDSGCVPVEKVSVNYEVTSVVNPFSCRLAKVSYDNNELYFGPAQWSCALGGGCSESTGTYPSSGPNFLVLRPGVGGTNNCVDQSYTVLCTLPPMGSTGVSSKVFSYMSAP